MDASSQLQMFKGEITALDDGLNFFTVSDFIDGTSKTVFLTGKQRFWYKEFSIGDIIYAVMTPSTNGDWKLVTGTDLKRHNNLEKAQIELDNYLSNLSS